MPVATWFSSLRKEGEAYEWVARIGRRVGNVLQVTRRIKGEDGNRIAVRVNVVRVRADVTTSQRLVSTMHLGAQVTAGTHRLEQ